ncbi:MAG: hypothetical protein F9Y92_05685 [Thermoplasmatales archaeon]|nr:hypothetical protein [Thermoplasmatales archaeon]
MVRIPIPLLIAAAVALGTVVTIYVSIVMKILGSYDTGYASFNGTHVVSTGTFPSLSYVYLYGGYGTAYFTSAVTSVVSFECVGSYCQPGLNFGRYFPVLIEVVSGSLPSGTNIVVTPPYGRTGGTCLVVFYFDTANMVAYVAGTSDTSTSQCGFAWTVPLKMYKDPTGRYYWLYPLARNYGTWSTSTACSVAKGTAAGYYYALSIMTGEAYDCAFAKWGSATIKWYTHASSTTTAALPNPSAGFSGWIIQTITGTGYTLKVYYAPLFFMQGPQPFAVKPS